MSNLIRNTSNLAFHLISAYISSDTIAVDGTCGNGHDTLALLNAGVKKIYSFDIQQQAIENTQKLLDTEYPSWKDKVSLINDCHTSISHHIPKADVILFNLGYLPGGDKSISTSIASTINAVKSGLSILTIDGICCLVMYDGHRSGKEEKSSLLTFAKELDSSQFHVVYTQMLNQIKNPPEILLITKKY